MDGQAAMKTRILIIDSDIATLKELERLLTSLDQSATTSCCGERGLNMFRANPPDIVLTEVLMPERDGIEIILEIKQRRPDTKVIAMSAGSGALKSEFVLHLASRLGADAVLSKPFTAQQLLMAIDAVFPCRADKRSEELH
jgi:CheY-like chemotaxis protein